MLITWFRDLYNYYFTEQSERETNIRNSLEIGDYDKELVNKIVNLKKPLNKEVKEIENKVENEVEKVEKKLD